MVTVNYLELWWADNFPLIALNELFVKWNRYRRKVVAPLDYVEGVDWMLRASRSTVWTGNWQPSNQSPDIRNDQRDEWRGQEVNALIAAPAPCLLGSTEEPRSVS